MPQNRAIRSIDDEPVSKPDDSERSIAKAGNARIVQSGKKRWKRIGADEEMMVWYEACVFLRAREERADGCEVLGWADRRWGRVGEEEVLRMRMNVGNGACWESEVGSDGLDELCAGLCEVDGAGPADGVADASGVVEGVHLCSAVEEVHAVGGAMERSGEFGFALFANPVELAGRHTDEVCGVVVESRQPDLAGRIRHVCREDVSVTRAEACASWTTSGWTDDAKGVSAMIV